MSLKTDAVFEGGGVKGIGLVGAVAEIEKAGYQFQNIAGTSAGAIVAALLAVGYTAAEIRSELAMLNYNDFKDEDLLDKFGIIGKTLSIGFEYGIYAGDYFEFWIERLLSAKGKTTFGSIIAPDYVEGKTTERYKYRLQLIATDITDRRLLVLPEDLRSFGFVPDELSISHAVRMSMSIPVFFEPVLLKDISGRPHIIIDGGVLSNYPIWLLDDGTEDPPWPTFGFKLVEPDKRQLKGPLWNPITNPVGYFKAIAGTLMDGHDNYHISKSRGNFDRTIGIPTVVNIQGAEKEIRTTDFDITPAESEALYNNGEESARRFIQGWDFEKWKSTYRKLR